MRDPKDNKLIRAIEKAGAKIISTPFDYIYVLVPKKVDYQSTINNVINIVLRYNNKAIGEFDYTLQEGYPEGYVSCIYNR